MMRWTVHLRGGPRRLDQAAVCIGDKIYSFGSPWATNGNTDYDIMPIYILDSSTFQWKEIQCYIENLPVVTFGHIIVAYGHKVFIWGEQNSFEAYETLSCFDTKSLKCSRLSVSGAVPHATDGHSACVIGNTMYIFGSVRGLTVFTQEVHYLNLDTFEWSLMHPTGTPPPPIRDGHTAVAYGNRMYVFGGRGRVNNHPNFLEEWYCPYVHYLDTIEAEWVSLFPSGVSPGGRRNHAAWVYRDHMYIIGGFNLYMQMNFNDLYRYSMEDNHWELLSPGGCPPRGRTRPVCILHEEKVYLFGGFSPPSSAYEDDGAEIPAYMDNSDLHILDYSPSLKTLSALAVIEYGLDLTGLPKSLILEIRNMSQPNSIKSPLPTPEETDVESDVDNEGDGFLQFLTLSKKPLTILKTKVMICMVFVLDAIPVLWRRLFKR